MSTKELYRIALNVKAKPIRLGRLNDKPNLARKRQKVGITRHQHVGTRTLAQVQKYLIFAISALNRATHDNINLIAKGKVFSKQK